MLLACSAISQHQAVASLTVYGSVSASGSVCTVNTIFSSQVGYVYEVGYIIKTSASSMCCETPLVLLNFTLPHVSHSQ